MRPVERSGIPTLLTIIEGKVIECADGGKPGAIGIYSMRQGIKQRHGQVTLKEVDYSDDEKEEWLQRNRTVMEKVGK